LSRDAGTIAVEAAGVHVEITPSMPGFLPSASRIARYLSSRAAPSSGSSARQPTSCGTSGGRSCGGCASWSAIFRNSSKVSCSTYSKHDSPASCSTPA